MSCSRLIRLVCILCLALLGMSGAIAQQTDLSDVPMVVKNTVRPNVLAVMDNSESMDAYMAGMLITGTNSQTRGNIGRRVLTDIVTTYRSNFNWGLMSFQLADQSLLNTYAYYFGDPTTMFFTDDCTSIDAVTGIGVSVSHNNLACVANPEPFSGGTYVTYSRASDDPDILDVLYIGWQFNSLWAYDGSGTCFNEYFDHAPVASWDPGTFYNNVGGFCYTPTDAGFTVSNPPYPMQFYVPRGYGYYGDITGAGVLIAPVMADDPQSPPYPTMMAALGQETLDQGAPDIKNAAVFTPLKGTLTSALNYFEGNNSPIQHTCQRNFVMLVTDGTPTGDQNGNLYSNQDRTNTYDGTNWNFGPASAQAIQAVTTLRSATLQGNPYDIQTYVIGLGDTVQNASAVATLNAMAAAGGTTSAYLAQNEAQLLKSIDGVAQDIIAKDGAAAAVTVSNPNIVAGDNASYTSTYNSGTWTGNLQSYPVNLTTGVIDTSTPNWPSSAQAQLDNTTPSTRYIVSYSGSQGIQFRSSSDTTATKLTSQQEGIFASPTSPPGPNDGAAVIEYLRGDRTYEGSLYRTRAHLLGDLVDAEPLLVRAPSEHYADPCYSLPAAGCTTAFRNVQMNRPRVVFQGSNDGMLHAFSAANGAELWAYVPQLVWGSMNLETRKSGFYHVYRVDGTPISGDVDFTNTQGSTGSIPDWHTMLIGGLAKGGNGYYALDVTNPIVSDEADAATRVMWEFPNATTNATVAANQGYSFGRPVLTKTAAAGWVVLVTSGYDNGSTTGGDGQGHLFVLNPRTGALIRDIPTGVGTPGSPSGLAKVSAYAANASVNNTTDFVYGGDLRGNVWRFDLTGTDTALWNVKKLATLVDASGTPQSITVEPQLAEITKSGVSRRFVYIGTGEYLGDSDVLTSQTQSMYGLIDDMTTTPLITPLRASLQQQTITQLNSTQRQLSSSQINYVSEKGWYVDFNLSSGERINADPQLAVNALVLTTNIPSSDVCIPGGSSWYYIIDYENGGLLQNTTQPLYSGLFLGNSLASRASLVQLPSGKIAAPIHLSDGSSPTEDVPVPASITGGRRVFWQEVINN